MSNVASSLRNFKRFSEARLQAELSRCIYSLQGLLALIRPALGVVCHLLIVVSNCIPGSAHSQAASAIWRNSFRALTVLTGLPDVTETSCQSSSFATAFMKSSVTRTELFA